MNVSATDEEFLRFFFQLNEPQKKSLLQMLKNFLHTDVPPETDTFEQYNQEIDAALLRVKNGRFTTLEELEKEMESW